MRATIEIDRDLLGEAVRATGAATKSVAVRLGLKALVDEAARRRLAALRGKVPEVETSSQWRPPIRNGAQ